MRTYRIFFASSYQLQAERIALVSEINRLNDKYSKKYIHLELVIWEKLDAGNDPVRKQNFYNEQLNDCDLLILAYWGQLGIFTNEEYQLAQNLFVAKGLPKIYIYKKTTTIEFDLKPENVANLEELETILYKKDKEQWPWEYENAEGFIKKFSDDLQARFDSPSDTHFIFPDLPKAKLLSPNGAANPNVFIGREDELKEIRKRLDNCGKLMLINAEGGIGKTTLAAKYWNESLHEYKHNAWLLCDNGIVNALKELAPKLNLDLAGMDENQQLNALKHALSGVHYDFLLVLDNANDDEDIRIFRQTFEGFHWHVLITSRCQGVLDKEQELPIRHLPPPLAKALFERYYKEDNAEFEALLEGLLQRLNYHTLSIELFAKTLKELAERGETMKHFVHKLETEGIFLGKRAKDIKTDYTHHTHIAGRNSDEILANFYNFTHLATNEILRFYLVNMAFLPAEEYNFVFLCELFKQDPIEFEALHQLATKGWLSKNGQKFKINPVIQEIALHKNKETLGKDSEALIGSLNKLFKLNIEASYLKSIQPNEALLYVRLILHLTKCLILYPSSELAIINSIARIISDDTIVKLNFSKNFNTIFDLLIKNSPDNLGYKFNLALSQEFLSDDYKALNNFGEAYECLKKGAEYYNQLLETNTPSLKEESFFGILKCSFSLGEIYREQGNSDEALKVFLNVFKDLTEAIEIKPIQVYEKYFEVSKALATIYFVRGNNKETINYIIQAENVANFLVGVRPNTSQYKEYLAFCYDVIGDLYWADGNLEESLQNRLKSFEIRELIADKNTFSATVFYNLTISAQKIGHIYQLQEQYNLAEKYYETALKNAIKWDGFKTNNVLESNILPIAYENMGNICKDTNRLDDAFKYYGIYHSLIKEIHLQNPNLVKNKSLYALSFLKLAKVSYFQRQLQQAIEYYYQSCTIFKEVIITSNFDDNFYLYNFAITCLELTNIEKHIHQKLDTSLVDKENIKNIRRDAQNISKLILSRSSSNYNSQWLYQQLSDETWYDF